MKKESEAKMVKRLNATLPDPLALYVGEMTGKGALYETPSEFIRDLLRRHMERHQEQQRTDINAMLARSLTENDYAPWSDADLEDARKAAS
ncbi:MAG: ribbon-helix-helix domain-containing protein [Magnetovibrionaceae bacterium]